MIHYGVVDAFYELFKLMLENDLTIKDLDCYPHCYESAYPNPIIDFTVKNGKPSNYSKEYAKHPADQLPLLYNRTYLQRLV